MSQKRYRSKTLNRKAHRKEEKIAKALQLGSVIITTAAAITASMLIKRRKE